MACIAEMKPISVALLGKVGHGKTFLINKLCGESFPSNMMTMSCTREINSGTSLKHKIEILDTPGFFSSDDSAGHLLAQKKALESRPLSGIFLVVKIGRSDEMIETLNRLMDFAGDDDIRVIVTHVDTVKVEKGFSQEDAKERMSQRLEIQQDHIAFVGKETSAVDIDDFIHGSLSQPREFEITNVQMASVAPQSVGSTRFKAELDNIKALIDAVDNFCSTEIIKTSTTQVKWDTTLLLLVKREIQKKVDELSGLIQSRAIEELTRLEDQKIVERKLDEEITDHLKKFLDKIEKWTAFRPVNGTQIIPSKKRARRNLKPETIHLRAAFQKADNENEWIVVLQLDGERVSVDQIRRSTRKESAAAKEISFQSNNTSFVPHHIRHGAKMGSNNPTKKVETEKKILSTVDPTMTMPFELEDFNHILDDDVDRQFGFGGYICPSVSWCSIM